MWKPVLIFSLFAVSLTGADTLDFERPTYRAGKKLDGQDGWDFNRSGMNSRAGDFLIRYHHGNHGDQLLRAHTHGRTEYSRAVGMQSGTVELKWRWQAPNGKARLCFGPSDSLEPGKSNWDAFRVKVCFNDVDFERHPPHGHHAHCGKRHENDHHGHRHGESRGGEWIYMRLSLDITAGRYSLYRDEGKTRDDEDTLVSYGSIKGSGPVSRIFLKAGRRSPYVDVDDIEWGEVGEPPPPPLVLTITSPAQDTLVNQTPIPVAFTVNGIPLVRQVALVEGPNRVIIDTVDAFGRRAADTVNIALDTQAPVVAIISPEDGFAARDSVIAVRWTVDGVEQTMETTESLDVGPNVITRSAADAAGNVGNASVSGTYAPVVCFRTGNQTFQYDTAQEFDCLVVENGGVVSANRKISADSVRIEFGGQIITDDTLQAGSVVVDSGGLISHTALTETETNMRVHISAVSLTLRRGSKIDVSGKGYPPGIGPGGRRNPVGFAGGSHAGTGENTAITAYGELFTPESAGAGGGPVGYGIFAGPGGGVVRIAADTFSLDGDIRADGETGFYGSGAGGGVWIRAQTLRGTGQITARGALSGNGFGGGGRIAMYAGEIPAAMDAAASAKGFGGGTVYLEDETRRELRIDSGLGGRTPLPDLQNSALAVKLFQGARAAVTGSARVKELLWIGVADASFSGVLSARRLHQQGGTLEVTDTCRLDTALFEAASVLTHKAGVRDSVWKVHLISDTVHLGSAARIDVTGMGFATGIGPQGQRSPQVFVGGSHGGLGASAFFGVYGSRFTPNLPGSGGGAVGYEIYGGAGGGVVRIAANSIGLDGIVQADGQSGFYGSGAGGSVWIAADKITGTGSISAAGSTAGNGFGGGGRVALYGCEIAFVIRDSVKVGGYSPGTVFRDCFDKPLVEILSPVNGKILYSAEISVVWKANEQRILSDTLAHLTEGINEIIRCFTTANGLSDCDTVTVRFDPNPPLVEILSPANGSYTTQFSIPVTWSIDGVIQTTQATQTLPIEGANRIIRSFTDSAGSFGADTIFVIKDTKAPVITLIHPGQSGVVLENEVDLRWAVDSVEQTPIHLVIDTSQANTILLRAVDSAGNSDSLLAFLYSGTQVPNLLGLRHTKAESTLVRIPLTPETTWVDNDTLPTGIVFEQSPNAGDSIRFHFPVRYKISRGLDAVDLVPQTVNADLMTVDPLTLAAGGSVRVVTGNTGRAAVNESFDILVFEDRNHDQRYTLADDLLLGQATHAGVIQAGDSIVSGIAVSGALTFNGNRISVAVDYGNMIPEAHEDNNYSQSMAKCKKLPTAMDYSPKILWSWTDSTGVGNGSVFDNPLIANMNDDNGDGKINDQDIPDVVVTTYNHNLCSGGSVRVLDGKDGHEIWGVVENPYGLYSTPAVGDIDADGKPEIVFLKSAQYCWEKRIVVLDNEGNEKAAGEWRSAGSAFYDDLTLSDLDGDGKSEIIWGYNIHDNNARLIYPKQFYPSLERTVPADLDGDGYQELVGTLTSPSNLNPSNSIFSFREKKVTRSTGDYLTYPSIPAVGRFGSGADPGILFIKRSTDVIGDVKTYDALLKHPRTYPGTGVLNPGHHGTGIYLSYPSFYGKDASRLFFSVGSTLATIDGDESNADIQAFFSRTNLIDSSVVYRIFPAVPFQSAAFHGAVFDINDDGNPEIVINSDDTLFILDSGGNTLGSVKNPPHTGGNKVTIADVNKDGHADMVVGNGNPGFITTPPYGWGAQQPGVVVYSNPTWVGARGIYNQQNYTVTNVGDDGSIPRFPTPHWQADNTANIQCTRGNYACVDVSASFPQITVNDSGQKEITARIGNGGALELIDGIPVSVYAEHAGSETLLATVPSPRRLKPGEFYTLSLPLSDSLRGRFTFRISADDSGNGHGNLDESSESNNTVSLSFLLNNQSPVIATPAHQYAAAGQEFTLQIQASDSDGDTLSYSLADSCAGMAIGPESGLFTWTPGQQPPRCTVTVAVSDPYEGSADASFLVYVDDGLNQPPQFTSTPITTATLNTLNQPIGYVYRYYLAATDPENGPVEFEASCLNCEGKPASRPQLESNLLSWIPFAPIWTAGDSVVMEVRAVDIRGGVDTQVFAIHLENVSTPGNHNPAFTTLPPTTAVAGSLYEYLVNSTDADGNSRSYFLVHGPEGMSAGNIIDPNGFIITNRGQVLWQVPENAPSTVNVQILVLDGQGGEARQTWQIEVVADDVPPGVSLTFSHNPVRPGESVTVTLAATDNVGVNSTSLSLNGNPVALSGGQYIFTPADTGIYAFLGQAVDADGNTGVATALLRVTPDADNNPPAVAISHSPQSPQAGQMVTFTVTASDDAVLDLDRLRVMVDGLTLPVQGGQAEYRALRPGNFTARAVAYDSQGNSALATDAFTVTPLAGDTTAPLAQITQPENEFVAYGKVELTGTAYDANLAYYTLSYRDINTQNSIEYHRSTENVQDGALGFVDATTLLNGDYEIRLDVYDRAGHSKSHSIQVQAAGEKKIGNFSLSFQDLSVPLVGLDLSVTRTYDSRDKRKGDFGIGWTLGMRSISLHENRNQGVEWSISHTPGFIPQYSISETKPHTVTVTLPGGRKQEFSADPKFFSPFDPTYGFMTYRAKAGTYSKLEALDAGDFLVMGGELFDLNGTFEEPYNPKLYKLTLLDGSFFVVDQTLGGVVESGDPNGNIISWEQAAYRHNAGRAMNFNRDGEGRITSISDGAGRSVLYSYDVLGNLAQVMDAEGNVTRFKYSSNYYLDEVIDPRGVRAERTEYDDEGRVVRRINANSDTLKMNHDLNNNTEVIEDFEGHVTTFSYDLRGNILSKTDDTGNMWVYAYDSVDNLIETVLPGGARKSSTFDDKGNELTTIDELEHTTTRTYNELGKVLSSTDPLGRTMRFEYDDAGNLTKETGPDGVVRIARVYNIQGNVTSERDVLGNVTSRVYNAQGWLTQTIDPLGRVISFGHDAAGKVVLKVNARGDTTRQAFSSNGNRILTVNVVGDTVRTEYNSIGKPVKEIDARGSATHFFYNNLGDKAADSAADGSVIRQSFDALGNIASTTDPAGRVTTMEYDHENRLKKTVFNGGSFTENFYDALGRRVRSVDANGNETLFGFDAAGRNTSITDALGRVTRYDLDAAGRRTAMVDALVQRTEYEYDIYDRPVLTRFADGTTKTISYDAVGQKTGETDPAGKETRFEYNAAGELTAVVDALVHRTEYTYSETGNRLTQKDANDRVTTMEYDPLNRMVRRVYPNGDEERWTFDANGNTLSHVKGDDSTAFAFDATNREVFRKHFPSSHEVRTTYTADGMRDSVVDYRGVSRFAYDNRGRSSAELHPNGDFIENNFDAQGNRVRLVTPFDTTRYVFDALNRMMAVVSPRGDTTRYFYNAVGNRDSTDNPNGTAAGFSYDNLNRLTEVRNFGGSSLLSRFTYTLNDAGIRTAVDELGGSRMVFSYDDLYRLTSEVRTGSNPYSISYTLDNVGNRLTQVKDGVTTTYTYNTRDQLTSESSPAGTVSYSFDPAGRQTSKTTTAGTLSMAWTDDDRLASVSGPGVSVQYEHDADGRRVKETAGAEVKQYLIDRLLPHGQVILETDGAGNLNAKYTFGLERISQRRNGASSWFLADGQGSIRQLTDTAGAVTDGHTYSAFGEDVATTGSTPHDFRYVGEQLDGSTGLYQLRARWMDPAIGRFLSVDPYKGKVGRPLSQHRYQYADLDPVNRIDPTGRIVDYNLNSASAATTINGILEAGVGMAQRVAGRSLWRWFMARLVIGGVAATTLTSDSWDYEKQKEWEQKRRGEPVERLQHYTTETGYRGIRADGTIRPIKGPVFLTPGVYFESELASEKLATCAKREWAVSLKVYRKADELGPESEVAPVTCSDGTRRGGGGRETSTSNPIFLGIYREPIIWWPLTD